MGPWILAVLELSVPDLWITNQFLKPMNQKFVKLLIFTNCFFQNRIILNNEHRQYVYLSRVYGVRLNDQRRKSHKLCSYTLKLNIVVNLFFMKQYFFNYYTAIF